MGKRYEASSENQDAPQNKRRKITAPNGHRSHDISKPEEIQTARQLQSALRFQQDGDLASGIQAYKAFLDSILYPENPDEVGTKRAILQEFLEAQKPRNGDSQFSYLSDVIETWSFALQTNNDGLISSVTAVLASTLKVLSTRLELQQHGIALCKTLLRIPQLKMIRRTLGAPKHKSFIISPALRLLTEIVSFDGGAPAKELYSHREYTFEPQLIAHHISGRGDAPMRDPSKPSVRYNGIRYLLANFKYQMEGAKVDIIKHGNISRALFAHVDRDAPSLVREVLDVVRKHVILDEEIPRGSKTYFLDDRNLASILGICRRHDNEESETVEPPIQDAALDFLRFVCTTPNLGVLLPCHGWYTEAGATGETETGAVRKASDQFTDTSAMKPTIRNTTLASFIQVLRPFASEQEMKLHLAIFEAAPELVADYFVKRASFTFEPSLTATWVGYAAFLFSVVRLPIPAELQSRPPHISVVVGNVLPEPLAQKVLTKCINSNTDMVRFFALRLLVVAINKLKDVLALCDDRGPLWKGFAQQLENQLAQRIPPIKDVITLLKKSTGKLMQYEAAARLLRLYYEIFPWLAMEAKIDVSKLITLELQWSDSTEALDNDSRGLRLVILTHLLAIAQMGSEMQWWNKPEGLYYTPFTALVLKAAGDDSFYLQNKTLLESLAHETGTSSAHLESLLKSLSREESQAPVVLDFIDECFRRVVRAPIKYADDIDSLSSETVRHGAIPLVVMTILEQLPFTEKSGHAIQVTEWAFSFLDQLSRSGDGRDLLTQIKKRMLDLMTDKKAKAILRAELSAPERADVTMNGIEKSGSPDQDNPALDSQSSHVAARIDAHRPPEEDKKLSKLHRWLQADVSEIIETGLDPLLQLCSSDESICMQAQMNLAKLLARLDPTQPEYLQHYVLLSELQECIANRRDSQEVEDTLPYLAATFALHAAAVLNDPAHLMYTRINQFLNRNPSWKAASLPSYWMKIIIDEPPDDDSGNTAWEGLEWLLDWLYDGLRTPQDLDILRRPGAFQKILAQYSGSPKSVKVKILEILMRATHVEGGSTTLITRFGVLGWLDAQKAMANVDEHALFEAIRLWMWETCDQARIDSWSRGEVRKAMEA